MCDVHKQWRVDLDEVNQRFCIPNCDQPLMTALFAIAERTETMVALQAKILEKMDKITRSPGDPPTWISIE